jgi:hypothetical protein
LKASIYSIGIICIIVGLVFIPLNPELWEIEIRNEENRDGDVSEERYIFLQLFDDFGFIILFSGMALISICYMHSKLVER